MCRGLDGKVRAATRVSRRNYGIVDGLAGMAPGIVEDGGGPAGGALGPGELPGYHWPLSRSPGS